MISSPQFASDNVLTTTTTTGSLTDRENDKCLKAAGDYCTNSTTTIFNDKEKLSSHFYIGNSIGEGAYGQVKLATYLPTGKTYAIKIISHGEKNLNEIEALKKLEGEKHIVSMFGYFYNFGDSMCLAVEYIDGLTLYHLITASKNGLVDYRSAKYIFQLSKALEFCHQQGIIHRDVKPENILITKNDEVKLIDFGLCEFIRTPNQKFYGYCGTAEFLAPEMLLSNGHSKEVDYWSVGILLYECLTKKTPFIKEESDKKEEIIERIKKGKMVNGFQMIDSLPRQCVQGLLTFDPSIRMNFTMLMNHLWILKMYQKAVTIFSKSSL